MKKKEIKVVCNYPKDMDKFQERYCAAMINALKSVLSEEEFEYRRKLLSELVNK